MKNKYVTRVRISNTEKTTQQNLTIVQNKVRYLYLKYILIDLKFVDFNKNNTL